MKMRQTFNYFVLAMLLAASAAFGQRAVMVNSNNGIVVYPTNIWEANVNPLRAAIGLGTNAILQPSTGGTGATNAAGARTNLGLVWTGLTNTNATDFRSALSLSFGALTNTNAASFRSAIGLPLSALTNTSTADFRSALGLTLGALTNTNAAGLRTDIGLVWSGLTNPSAATMRSALLPSYSGNSSRVLALNSSGTDVEWVVSSTNAGSVSYPISLANGGTGATNASGARASLGFSLSALTSTSTANFRSAILPSYSNNATKVLTVNSAGTDVEWASGGSGSIAFPIAVLNGGTGATNAATARTNLGLGATWLTNTDASLLRSDIGLGTGNAVTFGSLNVTGAIDVTNKSQTRANLGLAGAWLTNDTPSFLRGDLGIVPEFSNIINVNSSTNILAEANTDYVVVKQTNSTTTISFLLPRYFTQSSHYDKIRLRVIYAPNQGGNQQAVEPSTTIVVRQFQYPLNTTNTNTVITYSNTFDIDVFKFDKLYYQTPFTGVGGYWVDYYEEVSEGMSNVSGGALSVVSGGSLNNASGDFATIGGGYFNTASGDYSAIPGGRNNSATGVDAVALGNGSSASGDSSVVLGGNSGSAGELGAAVVGGNLNAANGINSFAAGSHAAATNNGAFVWADYQNNLASTFSSTAADSFNVRASGGSHFHNGSLYVYKTNVGPFEGLANLLASNNTTLSNETLFRVGLAEATNRSAQFGFRTVRTNNGGEGVAVFSVFGYNALMMVGPSDRSRTNTNANAAIEADVWTIEPTNRVMTLRDTNTGAMVMHRPIGFNTNNSAILTSAPANTTVSSPTGWIQVYVGTNSVRIPYYQ